MEGTDRYRIHDRQGAAAARNADCPPGTSPPTRPVAAGSRTAPAERGEGPDWQTPDYE